MKKIIQQKNQIVNFFLAENDLSIFFYFCKPRLSRNFLSIVHILFAKTYSNFVIFDHFFKTNKKILKIRKKSEKIHMYSDKLTNQFRLKKKLGYRFFLLTNFLFHYPHRTEYCRKRSGIFLIFHCNWNIVATFFPNIAKYFIATLEFQLFEIFVKKKIYI